MWWARFVLPVTPLLLSFDINKLNALMKASWCWAAQIHVLSFQYDETKTQGCCRTQPNQGKPTNMVA